MEANNFFSDKKNSVILILLFIIIVFAVDFFSYKSKDTSVGLTSTQSSISSSYTNRVGNIVEQEGLNSKNSNVLSATDLNTEKITKSNTAPNNCIDTKEVISFLGQTVCVEYFVGYPYKSSKGNIFLNQKLNYKEGFTVWIPANSVKNFSKDPVLKYGYKKIQVIGEIKLYKGQFEIIVNSEKQIKIID